jgi:hypothetical protein
LANTYPTVIGFSKGFAMTRFERHQRFLTRGVMSPDIAEREAIAQEVRRQADFFTGFSEDEEALLREIWSDLLNGTRELVFAKTSATRRMIGTGD